MLKNLKNLLKNSLKEDSVFAVLCEQLNIWMWIPSSTDWLYQGK